MNEVKIICPVCGQEYHPTEVYYPDEFFGHPTDIVRNSAGKLDFIIGDGMNLYEEYICDSCNNKFYVKANVSFETSTNIFEEEHVTHFKKTEHPAFDEGIDFDDIDFGTEE